jgi:hypothetical protein
MQSQRDGAAAINRTTMSKRPVNGNATNRVTKSNEGSGRCGRSASTGTERRCRGANIVRVQTMDDVGRCDE